MTAPTQPQRPAPRQPFGAMDQASARHRHNGWSKLGAASWDEISEADFLANNERWIRALTRVEDCWSAPEFLQATPYHGPQAAHVRLKQLPMSAQTVIESPYRMAPFNFERERLLDRQMLPGRALIVDDGDGRLWSLMRYRSPGQSRVIAAAGKRRD